MIPPITDVIQQLIANPPAPARCLSVKEAAVIAVECTPAGYDLSIEYALRRYRARKRHPFSHSPASSSLHFSPQRCAEGACPNPSNASLWDELEAKVDARLNNHPEEDDFAAIDHILSTDAPSRYFLSPLYAEKLYYHRRRSRSRGASPNLKPKA